MSEVVKQPYKYLSEVPVFLQRSAPSRLDNAVAERNNSQPYFQVSNAEHSIYASASVNRPSRDKAHILRYYPNLPGQARPLRGQC